MTRFFYLSYATYKNYSKGKNSMHRLKIYAAILFTLSVLLTVQNLSQTKGYAGKNAIASVGTPLSTNSFSTEISCTYGAEAYTIRGCSKTDVTTLSIGGATEPCYGIPSTMVYRAYLQPNIQAIQAIPQGAIIQSVELGVVFNAGNSSMNVEFVDITGSSDRWLDIDQGVPFAVIASNATKFSLPGLVSTVQRIVDRQTNNLTIGLQNSDESGSSLIVGVQRSFQSGASVQSYQSPLYLQIKYIANVEVSQVDMNNNLCGNVQSWNGSAWTDKGSSFVEFRGPSQSLRLKADVNVLSGTTQKFQSWLNTISNTSTELDQLVPTIAPGVVNRFVSRFNAADNSVTVRNTTDDVNTGYIEFKDPWYLDNNDPTYGPLNRGTANAVAHLRSVGSDGFKPDGSTSYAEGKYNGIFLNQEYNNHDYYTVNAIPPNGIGSIFLGWSVAGGSASFYNSNAQSTPVVFRASNTTITARYKGYLRSNTPTAFANNSARKTVRTGDGYIHLVYESMGHVWYEKLTSSGTSVCCLQVSQSPAKNPSIENVSNDMGTGEYNNYVAVVFQEQRGYYSSIKIALISNGAVTRTTYDSEAPALTDQPYTNDLNPVIAGFYNREFAVVWQEPYLNASNPGGLYCRRGTLEKDIITVKIPSPKTMEADGYSDQFSWSNSYVPTSPVDGTNGNSKYPAICSNLQNGVLTYHLLWQQDANSTTSDILYKTGQPIGYGPLTFSGITNMSQYCGISHNMRPSIVGMGDGTARACWIGEEPGYGSMTVFKSTDYYVFWYFGDNISSTSINTSSNRYVVGWSQYGPQFITDNRTLSVVQPLNTTGNDLQITNGGTSSDMYAISYSTAAAPYSFSVSNSMESFGKSYTTTLGNGRVGIIGKMSAQFTFGLGDITVDGQPIEFVDMPDTASFPSMHAVNKYLETVPFNLTNSSLFKYSVQYGVTDSTKAISALGEDGKISYRIELVDNATNRVLGIYDDVTFSASHVVRHANIGYEVSTKGIGSKSVRLRLVIEDNLRPVYTIAKKYAGSSIFLQKSTQATKIQYNQSLAITDYQLSQNYPNPFNPSTTISYQLPADGNVTVKVFDILGKEVATLVNGHQQMGTYSVPFDAAGLASGLYIYELRANDGKNSFVQTKKMMLLK